MKSLLLASLLVLTSACGKGGAGVGSLIGKEKGIPFVLLPVGGSANAGSGNSGSVSAGSGNSGSVAGGVATSAGSAAGGAATSSGSASGGDETSGGSDAGGGEASSGSASGGDETSGGSDAGGGEASSGSASGGDETSGGSESTGGSTGGNLSTSMTCDFSNVNDSRSFVLNIHGSKDKQHAILSNVDAGGKLLFDRYNLSPSLNENAAVTHEDKNLAVNGLKVIKISARIVMDESGMGELQVSYKLKQGKKMIQTDFEKLADINNCSSN